MRQCLAVIWVAICSVLGHGCARRDPPVAKQQAATDLTSAALPAPTAEAILQATSAYYAKMQSFQVDVVETMSLDRSSAREITADRAAVALARPNRISLPGADTASLAFHADGRDLWTVLGDRYSREPCPVSMRQFADDPRRNSLLRLSSLFLLSLLGDDARQAIMRDVGTVTVLEDEVLDGQLTHHLRLEQADFDWELWVAASEPRLVRQIVYDMSKQLGVGIASDDDDEAHITTTVRFENWRTNPSLDEATFLFRPSAAARQVEHVMGVQRSLEIGTSPP